MSPWWLTVALLLAVDGHPVTIAITPTQSFAPAWVHVRLHADPAPNNRMLVWACADELGEYTRSEYPLEGENSQATYLKELKDVPVGEYACQAVVTRVLLKPLYSTVAHFTVLSGQ